MKWVWNVAPSTALAVIVGLLVGGQAAVAQNEPPKIVHDAQYYVLDAQNGEQWAAEDMTSPSVHDSQVAIPLMTMTGASPTPDVSRTCRDRGLPNRLRLHHAADGGEQLPVLSEVVH